MNKWQEVYLWLNGGKMPRSKEGKHRYELLGHVKNKVIVHHPDFNGATGFKPAHKEELIVTREECDIPNGKISVDVLSSNLALWTSRGYKIEHV